MRRTLLALAVWLMLGAGITLGLALNSNDAETHNPGSHSGQYTVTR